MGESRQPPLGVTAVMLHELDFDEQIALCRELGVTHYTFRPRVIPDARKNEPYHSHGNHKFDLTPERFAAEGESLSAKLVEAGMTPFGSVPTVGLDHGEEKIRFHVESVAKANAGRMRIGVVNPPHQAFDYAALLERNRTLLRESVGIAKPLGVKLVLELHMGSLVCSPGLGRLLVQDFDPSEVGVIFDLPNFAREGGVAPHLAVAVVRDWIDHVHIGGAQRVTSGWDERGCRLVGTPMCSLEESDLHLPGYLDALEQAGVSVPLVIEDYTLNMTGEARLRRAATTLHRWYDGGRS